MDLLDIKTEQDLLKYWQEQVKQDEADYEPVIANMIDNEQAYDGTRKIKSPTGANAKKQTVNVRKIVQELVESQVDVNIPMPKVTSRIGREDRAMMIESMLRSEIDRMRTEQLIDEMERVTPTIGSSLVMIEWNNEMKTQFSIGEMNIKHIHPEQVIPQRGVFDIPEMDHISIKFEQTKQYVKNVYGVDVSTQGDEDEDQPYDHMCTHIFVFYKNEDGTIGLFSFVGNIVVQNYENYFARQQQVCAKCGLPVQPNADKCQACGSTKFKKGSKDGYSITLDKPAVDPMTGEPTGDTESEQVEIPYYVPDCYPIIMRKNVSLLNQFLGGSDADATKDHQNESNIYMAKIKDKMLKGGSILTLPDDLKFDANDDEIKVIRIKNASQKNLIDLSNLQVDISKDLEVLNLNYQMARQTTGITDSFQGRQDPTATSGKGKEIAANQTAGRLKSKRTMKDFAFSQIYEMMFKFMLAFADEPRPYREKDFMGKESTSYFDRRLFIEGDSEKGFYYDDDFIFSTDSSGTLANDRQSMWQETRNNFESGTYGPPEQLDTLVMFWTTMAELHYPGSKQALEHINKRKEEALAAAEQQQQAMAQVAEQTQPQDPVDNTDAITQSAVKAM